jgi:hypothetical protein
MAAFRQPRWKAIALSMASGKNEGKKSILKNEFGVIVMMGSTSVPHPAKQLPGNLMPFIGREADGFE